MGTAIYIRVSTLNQVDRDSLKNQESRLKNFCRERNLKIHKVYKDAGISAKDTKRPALEQLFRDVENNKVDTVVVTKLDRITRSIRDLSSLLLFFHEHNIKFISITQDINTDGAMGRFLLHLLGLLAQLEREITAERVAEDMYHRVSLGKWNGGIVPYGYTTFHRIYNELRDQGVTEEKAIVTAKKRAPEEKVLYVDEDEATIIRYIFKTYLKTKSLRGTTHALNSAGYRTRKGVTWATSSVQRILTNPTYIGKVWYGKRKGNAITGRLEHQDKEKWIITEGLHKGIVSESIFEEVQRLRVDRTRKPTRSNRAYLLSRILWCGKCGGKMHGYTYNDKRSGKSYSYYKCHNHISKGSSVCDGLSIPLSQLEDFIVDHLMNLEKDKIFMNDKKMLLQALKAESTTSLTDKDSRSKTLKKKEQELERRKSVLLDRLEREIIDDETFKTRFEELNSQLAENQLTLESLQDSAKDKALERESLAVSFEELSSFKEGWEFLDDESRAVKVRTIVKSITVTEKDVNLEIYLGSDSLKELSRTDMDS